MSDIQEKRPILLGSTLCEAEEVTVALVGDDSRYL